MTVTVIQLHLITYGHWPLVGATVNQVYIILKLVNVNVQLVGATVNQNTLYIKMPHLTFPS